MEEANGGLIGDKTLKNDYGFYTIFLCGIE